MSLASATIADSTKSYRFVTTTISLQKNSSETSYIPAIKVTTSYAARSSYAVQTRWVTFKNSHNAKRHNAVSLSTNSQIC